MSAALLESRAIKGRVAREAARGWGMKALGDVRWLERLPLLRDRPGAQLIATLAIVAAALALRLLLRPLLSPGLPFITFFPAVIIAGFLLGVRAGALAAVLGGLLGWGFFLRDTPVGGEAGAMPSVLLYGVAAALVLAPSHLMQLATAHLIRERERSRRLAEIRALLFHELQHRVSNNLQVAAGLLALQKTHVEDAAARTALEEAARRIATIGRISRQLYRADGAAQGVRELLEPLCADIVEAGGKRVSVIVSDPDHLTLAPDAAVPVALIVAEALANAIEHGFADRGGGTIEVDCRAQGSGFRIEVRDDGRGLGSGHAAGLGLRIATTLAGQLGARFEMVAGQRGATALLVRPDA